MQVCTDGITVIVIVIVVAHLMVAGGGCYAGVLAFAAASVSIARECCGWWY